MSISTESIKDLIAEYGETAIYNALYKELGYAEPVPTIDEFIESDEYLGRVTANGTNVYAYWRKMLREVYPTPFTTPYHSCLPYEELVYVLHQHEPMKIGDVVKELTKDPNKIMYTLGWDISRNCYVPSRIIDGQATKIAKSVYKITLSNGKSFRCTPEHKILLANNKYVKAQDLAIGQSVHHFEHFTLGNYAYVRHGTLRSSVSKNIYHKSVHRIVGEWKYGKINKKNIIHHKDFNPANNNPENLQIMDKTYHILYHSRSLRKLWDPSCQEYYLPNKIAHRKNLLKKLRDWANSKENIQRLRSILVKRWETDYEPMKLTSIKNLDNEKVKNWLSSKDVVNHLDRIREQLWQDEKYEKSRLNHKESLRQHMLKSGQSQEMLNKLWNSEISNDLKEFQRERFSNFNSSKEGINLQQRSKYARRLYSQLKEGETVYDVFERQNSFSKKTFSKYFENMDDLEQQIKLVNHKIVNIEIEEYNDWVYDIQTETQNFSLDAGTIVHNCMLRGSIGKYLCQS